MIQKTRALRVPAHHVATYISGERMAQVIVHDVSTTGIFVRSDVFDPEGTDVRLHLHTHLSFKPVAVSARVARAGRAPCAGMGLYFTDPDEQGHEVVRQYCSSFTQPKRLVYIDDDGAILRMMGRIVRDRGVAYVGIELPVESEYVMARFKPQVILLDVMMPRLNGTELARRLRNCPDTRKVAMAFYSASPPGDIPEDLREIPFIPKGCPLKELTASLDQLLGRPQLPA